MLYRFEDLELDLDTFQLRRRGEVVPIRKKTFDVLCYLIEHRDRVVPKQELLDKLWVGEHVNEATIPWYISNLRKTLGQQRAEQRPVETIHGRGYRFRSAVQTGSRAPREAEPPEQRPAGTATEPFVGRDLVMARLTSAVNSAMTGRGSVWVLRGEPGIGKTRCAAEFSNQLTSRKISVWMGRCRETPGQPAFWPWIQVLRNPAREQPGTSSVESESNRLLSLLVPHANNAAAAEPIHVLRSSTDRFWLYDRLHGFLRSSSLAEPRVIIIDDVHWADDVSLEFLSFIAPDVPTLRLLFVLTLRDHDGTYGRSVHLQRLLRYTEQIRLSRLSQEDIDQYVSQTAHFKRHEELIEAFYAKTGGNPLYLQETLRWLMLNYPDSHTDLTAERLRSLGIPDVIKDLLQRRLDALDQQARQVLDLASVVGHTFDLGLVSQALEREGPTLVAALDRAVDAGLVNRASESRLRFSHDLISEVACELLPAPTRADYHNRIAKALLNRADRCAVVGKAAFHLHSALPLSDIGLAISCAKDAALLSASVHAHGDAATYYRWAWDAMAFDPDVDPRTQAELLFSQSQQERFSGDVDGSMKTMNKALEVARRHRYFDIVADIVFLSRGSFLASQVPSLAALGALEEAAEHVPEEDTTVRVRVLSQLAVTHPHSLDMSRCKNSCEEALRLARDLGCRKSMRVALSATLYSLSGPDDTDALVEAAHQILELEREGNPTSIGGEAFLALVMVSIHRGEMAEAGQWTEAYRACMKKLQMTEGLWLYERLIAQSALHEGRFDEASQRFADLAQRGERIGLYYAERVRQTQVLHVIRARQGSEGVSKALGSSMLETHRTWPAALAEMVGLLTELGFEELVRTDYQELAARDFEDLARDYLWLNVLANLTLTAIAFGDRPRMHRLYELMRPYAEFNTLNRLLISEGSVAHFLGVLSSHVDEQRKTVQYFEQAMEANRSRNMWPYLARTQVVFAEWLADKPGTRRRATGKALAEKALSSAREMGMAPLEKRCLAYLGRTR